MQMFHCTGAAARLEWVTTGPNEPALFVRNPSREDVAHGSAPFAKQAAGSPTHARGRCPPRPPPRPVRVGSGEHGAGRAYRHGPHYPTSVTRRQPQRLLPGGHRRPQAQGPAVAVAWSKVPAGWFGDLEFAARHRSASCRGTRLPEGTGLLTGVRSIELRNVDPAWGHTYETRLAYDSEHGTVAVTVTDLTTGEQVYAGGADVRPHPVAQLLAPAPDGRTAYDIIEARPLFAPGPVRWRLLATFGQRPSATENVEPPSRDSRSPASAVKSMPGTFQLTAVVEGAASSWRPRTVRELP